MGLKGAILGDIAGSKYEFVNNTELTISLFDPDCFFTDDTILSIATKEAIKLNPSNPDFTQQYKNFSLMYPDRGYGSNFEDWIYSSSIQPYGSAGNGAPMRASYIGEYYPSLKEVWRYSRLSSETTHNTKFAVFGTFLTAGSIWIAKHGGTKTNLMYFWEKYYSSLNSSYSLSTSLSNFVQNYKWNELSKDSVPLALRCVYEANSYEDFLYNVLSVNCDTDTIAAIGGGIAEELFGLPNNAEDLLSYYLDDFLYDCVKK